MAWFALTNAARIAMVLLVVGGWAALGQLAIAVMRRAYTTGLMTLRTATRKRRRARLARVVATVWMYAIVFTMMLTTFIGMGVLMKDTADFFGFQKHILSWEYVLHPKFVALLCACGLSASIASVYRFRRAKVMNAAAYDAACKFGFKVFMGAAGVGFAIIIMLEAVRLAGDVGATMPTGEGVSKALAVLVASRAPLAGFGGVPKEEVGWFVDGYMKRMGVAGRDLTRLRNFAYSLPKRVDVAMESLQGRMLSSGFDAETARDAAAELRAAVVRLRKSRGKRDPPSAERVAEISGLKRIVSKQRESGATPAPKGVGDLVAVFGEQA
eukprot:jgi/Tetstr1/464235/TSEL_009040.t1